MTLALAPHISFRDSAKEAMTFYESVFGGTLSLKTFKDYHASDSPKEDEKIMHAELNAARGFTLMAADTPDRMEYRVGTNMSLALFGDDEKELTRIFQLLSQGGQITMPLEKAPWGDSFGMCVDKFGVAWMVNISAPKK
jgi:PhnB protein